MTLGQELDDIFYNIRTRITVLENNQEQFSFREDTNNLRSEVGDLNAEAATFATYASLKKLEAELADKETVLGIEADLTSQVERLEAELNDRIDELENDMGFDPDDLRCDLESRIEDVRDSVSYMDDRIDDIECYKITEDEARDIAADVVRDEISDVIGDYVNDAVCAEVNSRAVGYTEWVMVVDRVKELEDRLNKPSITARVMRWLREGPSIKETATSWYAGIRRGS